ncbi:hypothetical protein [Streptomyces sp. SAJ15]|uniref:hypothetical protein n=1 Tax=Streptomyces sp. SAJ15 TaxID=2011095 RepID=UPI001184CF82|nr:hypothetical protein [Streptomyces sp. SAJ15]TVL91098.1 hypothetical protein CD790_17545 [Streptomyces sp. SAJ15]
MDMEILTALLPRLGDRQDVWRAERELTAIGRAAVPELLAIRREGPGHLRRHALHALALLGAGDELSVRDQAALRRLVDVKLLADRPLDEHCPFIWMAVPAATYEGVFTALDLHDRVPATMAMGMSGVEHAEVTLAGPDGAEVTAYRAFVTPEFSGWRMVFGPPVWGCTDNGLLARVSEHCGQAHYYARDSYDDAHAWAIAEEGRVIRSHSTYDEPRWTHEPLPWEEPQTADPLWEPGMYEPNASCEWNANEVADRVTVDPERITEDTPMAGHGWLAVTVPGIGHGPFPGALSI